MEYEPKELENVHNDERNRTSVQRRYINEKVVYVKLNPTKRLFKIDKGV